MGMKVVVFEVGVGHSPALAWQTHVKNLQTSLPAVVPEHYASLEYLDGPPLAPGGVVLLRYADSFPHYDYLKFLWEEIDHDKFHCRCKIIEGGGLGKHFTSITYSLDNLCGGENGDDESRCIMRWTLESEDIGEHDFHSTIQDELTKFSLRLDTHLASISS